jgi:hypothetical protein
MTVMAANARDLVSRGANPSVGRGGIVFRHRSVASVAYPDALSARRFSR